MQRGDEFARAHVRPPVVDPQRAREHALGQQRREPLTLGQQGDARADTRHRHPLSEHGIHPRDVSGRCGGISLRGELLESIGRAV